MDTANKPDPIAYLKSLLDDVDRRQVEIRTVEEMIAWCHDRGTISFRLFLERREPDPAGRADYSKLSTDVSATDAKAVLEGRRDRLNMGLAELKQVILREFHGSLP